MIDMFKERLRVDIVSGKMYWLPTGNPQVDSRFAGKEAGTITPTALVIKLNGKRHYCHRIIWLFAYGEPVPDMIDHIDNNPHNNAISNLRATDYSGNKSNSKAHKNTLTGIKGITLSNRKKKPYRVMIMLHGKQIHVGNYATLDEAIEARQAIANKLHGEFAR